MSKDEALQLMNTAEKLFKNHEEFTCIGSVYDPLKLFSREENISPTKHSRSFQLEFMYKDIKYIILYNQRLKLLDTSSGMEYPTVVEVDSFEDIINYIDEDEE